MRTIVHASTYHFVHKASSPTIRIFHSKDQTSGRRALGLQGFNLEGVGLQAWISWACPMRRNTQETHTHTHAMWRNCAWCFCCDISAEANFEASTTLFKRHLEASRAAYTSPPSLYMCCYLRPTLRLGACIYLSFLAMTVLSLRLFFTRFERDAVKRLQGECRSNKYIPLIKLLNLKGSK